jgi:1-deoxy-D-xylulose-5-phosphate reductoisomerase
MGIDPAAGGRRQLVVLGSTGSIGGSCLDVVDALPDRLAILGLAAHSRWEVVHSQVTKHKPRWVALTDPAAAAAFAKLPLPRETRFLHGPDAIEHLVRQSEADIILTAIVGAAGLNGTWHALDAGKTVAVANKETLVMAGPLIMDLAAKRQARVLPVDSEHSAIFQALQAGRKGDIARVVLTASGGPFRGKKSRDLAEVNAEQALNHPTWRMGPKITVDSATLMNKALEIVEARWLFDLRPEQIEVIIHPESIVHSFVEFIDGSVLAQLSPPDMRLPIQYALTYPVRVSGPARRLNWMELSRFTFEQPDRETFPALELGWEVARRGGTCGAVLNAANEAAVGEFLAGKLRFLDIPRACRAILDHHPFSPQPTLQELHGLDRWARQEVIRWNTKTA